MGFLFSENTPQYFAFFSTNHNENLLFDYVLVVLFFFKIMKNKLMI
jgi:hypothetical protein